MCIRDRSGEPGRQPFAVQCTSIANLDRVIQNRKFEAMSDMAARQAALDAAEANGTRVKPCLLYTSLVCLLKTINGIHSPEEAICSLHPSGSPSADKDHGLLVPQRDHRIHPHSAARREITGQQGDQRQ